MRSGDSSFLVVSLLDVLYMPPAALHELNGMLLCVVHAIQLGASVHIYQGESSTQSTREPRLLRPKRS
jgi:hypothetical protein